MVNVTWITPFAPDRSGGGGQIRQAHLLLALAERARVQLICPGPVIDADVRRAVARIIEVDPVAAGWRGRHVWLRRFADLVASVASHQPIEVRAFRPVRRRLRSALPLASAPTGQGASALPWASPVPWASAPPAPVPAEGTGSDVVLVEFAGLAPLVPAWRNRAERATRDGVWLLTLHNLPSRMAAHQEQVMPHRRQRWLLARDARVAACFERRAAATFDAVIATSEEDAAALGDASHVLVVPNGSDVERFRPTALPADPRVVFTGALYTTPNVDAAKWFCCRVWPLVRLEEPSAQLDLVGAGPVADVVALGELDGVTLHPDVVSVVPYLQAARTAVVPVRVGSGTRLKALEALAAGRPVVGTSIGLEGLGLRAGDHVLVADDAESFARSVVSVLRDDALASRLAASGRAEVERRFAWSAIGAAFADSILDLAEARRLSAHDGQLNENWR